MDSLPNTLEEAYSDFKESRIVKGCKPKTLEFYEYTVGYFLDFCRREGVMLQDIQPRVIRKFLARLRTFDLSAHTVHAHARGVKAFLRFCHRDGIIDHQVEIEMPRLPQALPRFVSLEDIKEALDYFEYDRDKAMMVFLWETGIRRGKLVALDWGDIAWDAEQGLGEAIIRNGKGGKDRIVFFNSFAWRYLKIYRDQVPHEPTDPVFQSLRTGKRLTGDGAYQVFYNRRGRLPKPLHPHLFRHSFGRHAMIQGMPPAALKELMGHESIETTMIYARFTEPMVRDAYKKHMCSGNES